MGILHVLLVVSLAATPRLDSYQRENGPFGHLYFRGGEISFGDDRVREVQRALEAVEKKLNRRLGRQVTVVLVPDRAELARIVVQMTDRQPADSVLGMAFPRRGWILVREDGSTMLPWDRPRVTLMHEFSHLVVGRRATGSAPRWLDEGIAMWVSQNSIPSEDEARLSGLARIGGLFRSRDLERTFPDGHQLGSVAYQQSYLMVTYLVERHGKPVVSGLLDRLEEGPGFWGSVRGSDRRGLGHIRQGLPSMGCGEVSVVYRVCIPPERLDPHYVSGRCRYRRRGLSSTTGSKKTRRRG